MGAVELTMIGAAYRSFQNWNIERVERYSGEIYVFTFHCAHFCLSLVGGGGEVREQNIFYHQRLTQLLNTLNNGTQQTVYVRIIIILFTSTDYWTIKWKEKVIFNN